MQKHETLPAAFADLGLETAVLRGLADAGFETPSDIQREMIPHVLSGRDVIGQARTGTGKTAAFGLPLLQMLNPKDGFQALVLTPTRELAVQVTSELQRLGVHSRLHIVPVYGGQRVKTQIHQLGKKPHIVVGTPGRVMDFMGRGHLRFEGLRVAILDEVDRMLDIGFRDDIRRILGTIHNKHQTVFVSATIDAEIRKLAETFTDNPISVNVSQDEMTVGEVTQKYITVQPWDKFRALMGLIDREDLQLAIIFTNTKHAARKLAKRLHHEGVNAKEIHGDLVQTRRERVMDRFRKHKIRVLVATDLAARGIDVSGISHIINYDFPKDPEVYVHRIGRTARMGAFGAAFSFVTPEEGKELTQVEMLINKEVIEDQLDGFQPSSPPDGDRSRGPGRPSRPPAPPPPPAKPRPDRSMPAAAAADDGRSRPKRTLGGKFRPSRRRRR